jgi:hypothetical protein
MQKIIHKVIILPPGRFIFQSSLKKGGEMEPLINNIRNGMENEKKQAYWKAVKKWAERAQVLVEYQDKNLKWALSPEIVRWFTPSYESSVARLEREVERLEKEADRLEVEAGLNIKGFLMEPLETIIIPEEVHCEQ